MNVLHLREQWKKEIFILLIFPGGAGAVDPECRPDPGEQRPKLPAAEDSFWTDSLLLYPADFPLHLREQKDGHHRQGVLLKKCDVRLLLLSTFVLFFSCFFFALSLSCSVPS